VRHRLRAWWHARQAASVRHHQIAARSAGGRNPLECRCFPDGVPTKNATPALLKYLAVADPNDRKVMVALAFMKAAGESMNNGHDHSLDLLFSHADPVTGELVWDSE
jgi:hypothetical protein